MAGSRTCQSHVGHYVHRMCLYVLVFAHSLSFGLELPPGATNLAPWSWTGPLNTHDPRILANRHRPPSYLRCSRAAWKKAALPGQISEVVNHPNSRPTHSKTPPPCWRVRLVPEGRRPQEAGRAISLEAHSTARDRTAFGTETKPASYSSRISLVFSIDQSRLYPRSYLMVSCSSSHRDWSQCSTVTMSGDQELVDLSLFAHAPTNEIYSRASTSPVAGGSIPGPAAMRIEEHYAPISQGRWPPPPPRFHRGETMKPLPPLPRTRLCQQAAGRCDDGSQCILKRIRRTATYHGPNEPGALLQRRNPATTPQLTLSVPQPHHGDQNPPSSMIWMPDEQMWLVVGEIPTTVEYYAPRPDYSAASAEPIPPTYSPRNFTRSEPSTRAASPWETTPPPTALQSQLQSLLQPQDEERLSPLFQEAMNSVPLTDQCDLPPPPSYEGTMRRDREEAIRPHMSARESFISALTESDALGSVHRARTSAGHSTRSRSQDSTQRSFSRPASPDIGQAGPSGPQPSLISSRPTRLLSRNQISSESLRPWHGLAKKIARPPSATQS